MYVCTYVCTWVCMHICMYVCMHVCMCVTLSLYICVCTCKHVYAHSMRTYFPRISVYLFTSLRVFHHLFSTFCSVYSGGLCYVRKHTMLWYSVVNFRLLLLLLLLKPQRLRASGYRGKSSRLVAGTSTQRSSFACKLRGSWKGILGFRVSCVGSTTTTLMIMIAPSYHHHHHHHPDRHVLPTQA